jgi:hypothetical protein
MTSEAMRIAILENTGWKYISEGVNFGWLDPQGHKRPVCDLPNPPCDLNAMHEAEKILPALPYLYRLQEICGGRMEHSGDLSKIIKATAAQRAEAFLRTIGKWEA